MVNRQNKTIRPDVPILDSEANQSELIRDQEARVHLSLELIHTSLRIAMDQIRSTMTARTADLRLYLDYNPDPSKWAVVGRSGLGESRRIVI